MCRRHTLLAAILSCVPVPACAPPTRGEWIPATIGGRMFRLELAATEESHRIGLAGRSALADDAGMVFVFPEPQMLEFVMRDCAFPIDLLYIADDGRVISTHAMAPEPPRTPAEHADRPAEDFAYTARLTPHASPVPCRIAIEIRGGLVRELGITNADRIEIDLSRLPAAAK